MHLKIGREESLQCEFCSEFAREPNSHFRRYFRNVLGDRVVLATSGFVAIPSMGQIVPDSLMLLPTAHVERFADLALGQLRQVEVLIQGLIDLEPRPITVFEHGARAATGGSCGIYHAHLHLVPMPPGLIADDLAEGLTPTSAPFPQLLADLVDSDEYLMISDGLRRSWRRSLEPGKQELYPSQYFRRRLSSAAQVSAWDWREVPQPEPAMVQAYHHWKTKLATNSDCSWMA